MSVNHVAQDGFEAGDKGEGVILSFWLEQSARCLSFTELGNSEEKRTGGEVSFGHGATDMTYRTLRYKL